MRTEHARLEALGKLFGCSDLLERVAAAIKATTAELAALAAVWQQAAKAQQKLAEWNQTVSSRDGQVVRLDVLASHGWSRAEVLFRAAALHRTKPY